MMGAGLTVSELNQVISDSIRREPGLRNVLVTGEIGSFKHHLPSGHWYFTLKDAKASISCVMFHQNTVNASLRPRDGDRVTLLGYVEMYARDGKVQLYVTALRPSGAGSLFERFEALKQKLLAEGLFDQGRKRTLPLLPRKVAVITSLSGAALRDILNVSRMRNPSVPLALVHSGVQGAGAAEEIVRALKTACMVPEVDVIILARGGGSAEDLWCFNEECVARAVAGCPIPVVSGVGHETDFTICDMAADVRASTPSNAAEIVIPDRKELLGRTNLVRTSLIRSALGVIHQTELLTHSIRRRLEKNSPENGVRARVDQIRASRDRLLLAERRRTEETGVLLDALRMKMEYQMNRRVSDETARMQRAKERLGAISPLAVLDRGYALVFDQTHRVIPCAEEAKAHASMTIRFHDGQLAVERSKRK